jgi:hypothetical protein
MDAGTEIGRWRILRVLEDGVVTTVLAEPVDGGDRVRLRIVDPTTAALPANQERFRADTRLAVAVADCPWIVPVLDVGETDGGSLFVAERASDDETLAALLDRSGPLVAADAIALVAGRRRSTGAVASAAVLAPPTGPGGWPTSCSTRPRSSAALGHPPGPSTSRPRYATTRPTTSAAPTCMPWPWSWSKR